MSEKIGAGGAGVDACYSRSITREYDYRGHHIIILYLDGFYASYIKLGVCIVNPRWFSSWVDYCHNFVIVDASGTKRDGLFVGHSYREQSELDLGEIQFDTELAVERLIQMGL